MLVIQMRRKPDAVSGGTIQDITDALPEVAIRALACKEFAALKMSDVMIENSEIKAVDHSRKDFYVRVYARDCFSRRDNIDIIRKTIAEAIVPLLAEGVTWGVAVILQSISYGSDTDG